MKLTSNAARASSYCTAPHRSNSNSNIHGYVKKILIVHDFDDDDDDDDDSSWED